MALLTRLRRPQRSVDESRMSVIEHLEALRRSLIIAGAGWLLATVAAYLVYRPVFLFLIHRAHLPHEPTLLAPTEGVFIGIKMAFYMGLVIASPIVFWQMWSFISPGLHHHEKRLLLPLIAATTFFFLVGVAFAIYALPLFMGILAALSPPDTTPLWTADSIIGFVLAIVLAFGVVFELPVVLYTLGLLRIISSRWLYRHRLYWVIALGLIANVMTPGVDPITPLLVFIPLWIFWEGTALLLKLSGR
jgi:sec-independent protein translocase protein TatC